MTGPIPRVAGELFTPRVRGRAVDPPARRPPRRSPRRPASGRRRRRPSPPPPATRRRPLVEAARRRSASRPGGRPVEAGRVAVPDAGPITAPIPAIGARTVERRGAHRRPLSSVEDEPAHPSVRRRPPRPIPAAPSAAAPSAPAPRRVAVRATALALLLALVGGGATALAMDKTITVTVDGQDRVVHTFAADVGSALQAAGIDAAPQDRVEPALPTDGRQRRPHHLQPGPQADPRRGPVAARGLDDRGHGRPGAGRPRRAGPADPDVHLARTPRSRWPGSRWSSGCRTRSR